MNFYFSSVLLKLLKITPQFTKLNKKSSLIVPSMENFILIRSITVYNTVNVLTLYIYITYRLPVVKLRCIFQIPVIVVTLSINMQISVLGDGVDTVWDHHPRVPGFNSRRCLILLGLFQNQTRHDLHDVTQRFRMSPSGYANTQRVTQPVILLCSFQVTIQQNMIDIKYLFWSYQWHCLVVTVSDW